MNRTIAVVTAAAALWVVLVAPLPAHPAAAVATTLTRLGILAVAATIVGVLAARRQVTS